MAGDGRGGQPGPRPRRYARFAGSSDGRGIPLSRPTTRSPRAPRTQAPRPAGARTEPPAAGRSRPVRPGRRRGVAAWLAPRRRDRGQRRPLTPAEHRERRRRRLRRALLGTAAALVLAPVLAFGLGYLFFEIPTPDEAVDNQVALLSYADGSQLARLVPEAGNRTKVTIDRIPVGVRHAVLAAEDRSFYSNPGFDLTGILRAVWNQLRGGVGGGSTITQQYVKVTLVGDDVSLWRKYREMILSVKLSGERTKDEILTDYLNTIYFGRGAYGVQSASQAYFGKDVSELSLSEGALLAGVIQSPSRWDPARNPDKALQRWTFVLDGMLAQGWVSPAERAEATFPATVARRAQVGGSFADSRGHIINAVRNELEDLGITDQEFAQGGLRISTTIDPEQQEQAVRAAQTSLARQPANLRSAVVAVDPRTGGIRAYYGGDNGVGLDYARVRKQPGSTFKPFVVLAGLLHDPPVGIGEVFDGREQTGLRNAEGADCDRCNLKEAMTVSNNVIFTRLAAEIGPANVAAAARAAGISSPLNNPDERLGLGNKEVSPVELASAYATIAAGGVWHQPHLVAKVVTSDDRVLYEAPEETGERRFGRQVARNVTEAMLDVADRDGVSVGRPVAAKTGTVQSRFKGENNDAWFAGFTPQLSTVVWIGTDMNSPIRSASGAPISGSTLPSQVWEDFMAEAVQSDPEADFGVFTPIGKAPVATPADPTTSVSPAPDPADPVPSTDPLTPFGLTTGTPVTPTPAPPPRRGLFAPAPQAVPAGAPSPQPTTLPEQG